MEKKNWCYIIAHPNLKVKIDSEDLKRVSTKKWRVVTGMTGRQKVVTSFRKVNKVTTISLGKFLMNPPKGKQVLPRRLTNDGLDYRKRNLVICTIKERQRMLPKRRTPATSSFRGVSFVPGLERWRARIEVEGMTLSLGQYDTEVEAATAYNLAALEHYGPRAYQNPVRKGRKKRAEDAG